MVPQDVAKGQYENAMEERDRLVATERCARALHSSPRGWVWCWDAGAAARAAVANGSASIPASPAACPSYTEDKKKRQLQGGAIFVRRSQNATDFVRDWIETYVSTYADEMDDNKGKFDKIDGLGNDQPPLRDTVANRLSLIHI